MAIPDLRIRSPSSALSRWQADWVANQLAMRSVNREIVAIATEGDRRRIGQLPRSTSRVCSRRRSSALLDGRIDLAVHSLKDLPTAPTPALVLAAVPLRESPADVLVSRSGERLEALPASARIGTGSPRRRAQLLNLRPDLEMTDIRGNVDTRLRKLDLGQYDAVVLAEAGLARLGLAARITQVFSPAQFVPAAGQGALGLESRSDDELTRRTVAAFDDPATRTAVEGERAALAALGAGCLAPAGARGRIESDGNLHLTGVVLSVDGARRILAEQTGPLDECRRIGESLAAALLADGAADLIRQAQGNG